MTRPSPPRGTQSVERAFAVLRAFSDTHRVWALADMSRLLGFSKPTTLRLLGALEREGMVQRVAEGGYRLGPAAIRLGALAQRANDLPRVARSELERLAWQTGETATMEVLDGREIVVLDQVRGRLRGSAAESVGSRWPAHAAATGKVLLAAGRNEGTLEWRRFLATSPRRLARFTEQTITSVSRLTRALEQARRQGFATAMEELESGYVAIGAPVRDHADRVIAALCVGGPSSRLAPPRLARLIRRVREAADRVSDRLGAAAMRGQASA